MAGEKIASSSPGCRVAFTPLALLELVLPKDSQSALRPYSHFVATAYLKTRYE